MILHTIILTFSPTSFVKQKNKKNNTIILINLLNQMKPLAIAHWLLHSSSGSCDEILLTTFSRFLLSRNSLLGKSFFLLIYFKWIYPLQGSCHHTFRRLNLYSSDIFILP